MRTLWNSLSLLVQDIRIGGRMIARIPVLALAVMLTLSIGIGISAGVFTLLNPIAFRPAVADDPDSYFGVAASRRDLTAKEYHALRDQSQSVRELAAWARLPFTRLNSENGPGFNGILASCNIFSVFTAEKPLHGRLIQPANCEGADAVMVLSERSWREQFGADPNVIGKTVVLLEKSVTIVGVLAPQWSISADSPLADRVSGWVSMEPHFADRITQGQSAWLHLSGRLQSGYSRDEAATELQLLDQRYREDPATVEGDRVLLTITLNDGSLWAREPAFQWQFVLALALPALLLLIASVNVATLLLSRAAGRQREMAIRLSMGAGRMRLIRMLLVENTLLVAGAAVLSLLLVYWVPAILYRYLVYTLEGPGIPPQAYFAPDWRAFLYLGACAVVATLCSGITPAFESLNLRLSDSLAGRQLRGGRHSASRLRGALVAVQVALSMVPLVLVGMYLRTEGQLTNPGFEIRQVARISLLRGFNPDQTLAAVAERLEGVPGIRSVAYAWDIPGVSLNTLEISPYEGPPVVAPTTSVSSKYFETMGIPILAGQSFQNTGLGQDDSNFAVISQRLARRLFPEANPLGQLLDTAFGPLQIVGVAKDVAAFESFVQADGSMVYQRIAEGDRGGILLARVEKELSTVIAGMQTIAQGATGGRADILPLSGAIDNFLGPFRRMGLLLAVLGVVSLALAVIGVFGVVSFTTSLRRKEIAIRLAVGADGGDIVRTILARGLQPIPIGIAGGLLLTWGGLRIASSQSFLSGALALNDPMPYAAVCVLLLLISIAAMLAAAHRSVWSDSVRALHEE